MLPTEHSFVPKMNIKNSSKLKKKNYTAIFLNISDTLFKLSVSEYIKFHITVIITKLNNNP